MVLPNYLVSDPVGSIKKIDALYDEVPQGYKIGATFMEHNVDESEAPEATTRKILYRKIYSELTNLFHKKGFEKGNFT